MIPRAFSQASSRRVARKFEGSVTSARTITPRAPAEAAEIDRFDVFLVRADIADMGKGEGDDLAGIGGIGQNLLIAGHRRVEADFADRRAGRAETEALPV